MPEPSVGIAARVVGASWTPALAVGVMALAGLGWGLGAEPFFADESAYFSQSYYAGLFASGLWGDPAWVDYPAYDLPPLPKYLIGAALRVSGYRTPGPAEARAWYGNTMARFDPPGALAAARVPMVVTGAVGCVAAYGLGVLAAGRGVGVLAAVLLLVNPLYRMQSRRAMSDVPCEAFMLVAVFFGLLAWSRLMAGRATWAGTGLAAVACGLAAGLSLLSKLSGTLALMVLVAWVGLALVLRPGLTRVLGVALAGGLAAGVAFATFVALDPYTTARPSTVLPAPLAAVARLTFEERIRLMFRLRFQVSAGQKSLFPHNALNTPAEKLAVSLVQGFGRFGPAGRAHSDSTKRFDPSQDWGAAVWLPCVAAGVCWAWRRGRAQRAAGEPPTAWAVLVQFAVAFSVVTLYLPMAWDRYLLPFQASAALLASGAVAAAVGRVVRGKGPGG